MSNDKYLRITMYNNDFVGSLKHMANVLYEIFQDENRFPEEDELPLIEKYVKELWFSIDNISSIMRWNKNSVAMNYMRMQEIIFPMRKNYRNFLINGVLNRLVQPHIILVIRNM